LAGTKMGRKRAFRRLRAPGEMSQDDDPFSLGRFSRTGKVPLRGNRAEWTEGIACN